MRWSHIRGTPPGRTLRRQPRGWRQARVRRQALRVPVHGEHRHLYFHAELAKATGIPDDHIFMLENGDVLELRPDHAEVTGQVQAAGPVVLQPYQYGWYASQG